MKTIFFPIAVWVVSIVQAKVTPEAALGGKENLRLVLSARIISLKRVAPAPIEKFHWEEGHLITKSYSVNDWSWGMPLRVERGPVSVPAALATQIKNFLQQPFEDWRGGGLGYSYHPQYRLVLREEGHTLQILVTEALHNFDIYRDGGQNWHFQRQ